MDRKRDAFRHKIRRNHIDNLFKANREQSTHIDIDMNMNIDIDMNSDSIKQIEEIMGGLPASVHRLVSMVNNKGKSVMPHI